MTREDAIYEIKQLAVLSTNKNIERITEALNMAIEALQTEPTISKMEQVDEPQTCSTCKHKGDERYCRDCYEYSLYGKDEPQTERSE